MKTNKNKVLGSLWVCLGLVATPWEALKVIQHALDPEYGISSAFNKPSFWISWALFPIFFTAVFVTGLGLFRTSEWAFRLLKILSPIMLLYTTLYVTFGGAEGSWLWWFIGLAGAILGGFSMVFAYSKRIQTT
ncbi:MAG: hypothetical protein HXX11_10325 [Desulfuromonadales bacterium]|nr:hypothetical protein [Desulfuromonadales bacterium]